MKRFRKIYFIAALTALVFIAASCTISYKFNGASIDYTKVKSVSIADFPNNAEYVVPTLSQTFAEALRDKYTRQTRLKVVKQNGDMQLEGEITGYQIASTSISADSYAAKTRITLTINVRFTNAKNSDENFETKYTSFQEFDNSNNIRDVENDLIKTMVDEIVDKIFNDTAAKW